MLSVLWLNLLDRLVKYLIHPDEIEQVLSVTNNIMTLGYTYEKLRTNKHPAVVYKLTHISRLIA